MKISTFLLFLSLVFLFACKPDNPFIQTPISGAIVIDKNEQEIVLEKPFKPTKQVNEICFEYPEDVKINPDSTIINPPKFADGTPLIVTGYLFDQNGKKYETTKITRLNEKTVCFVPEDYFGWLAISRQNVTFNKFLVSSNRKINILKIEWKSYDAWDMK